MTSWITLAVTLAGVNLVRATRRGPVVAIGSVLVLVVLALLGGVTVDAPGAFACAVGIGGAIVATWEPLVLRGGRRRMALGLMALVVGGAAQVALLGKSAAAPSVAWLWASALFFLADPSTRLLRWVLTRIGRPLTAAAESYGRGEAIGVLERWLTLVVIAHGEYGAMGFILAAKALARHKRFETDADFAEYFLVGTLASVLLAIAVAEALHGLGLARP